MQAVERLARPEPAGLDLAEHDRAAVGEHEVQLAPAGVVVLREDVVAEPREVLRGEALAEPSEVLSGARGHGPAR